MNPSIHSLKTRLALTFALLTFVLTAVFGFIIGKSATRQVEREIGRSLAELAYQMQDKLDRGMFERFRDIQIAANLDILLDDQVNERARKVWLEALQSTFTDYLWIGLVDVQGKVLVSTNDILKGASVAEQDWFQRGLESPFIGDVHKAEPEPPLSSGQDADPSRLIDIAVPVMNSDGLTVGVLGAQLSWAWARNVRSSVLEPFESQEFVGMLVLDRAGRILLGPPELEDTKLNLESVQVAKEGENRYLIERWPDGKKYLVGVSRSDGHRSYPGLGWLVLVRQHVETAFAPAAYLQQQIFIWGAVVGALFTGLGWWFAGRIAKPLIVISQAAERIRQGDTSSRLPTVSGYAEVVTLSHSLGALVTKLTKSDVALEALNQSLERRVQERTQELLQTNTALQAEIEERQRVERERERLIAELRTMAETDNLTGALNRRSFFARANQEILRAKRFGRFLAVIMLDIDHFKRVNDTYGHRIGDEVIRSVVASCRSSIREIDFLGRYGGEEFMILAQEVDDQMALLLAERLRESIENMRIMTDKGEVSVTVSFGIAAIQEDIVDVTALINRADAALYEAKRAGRNRVAVA